MDHIRNLLYTNITVWALTLSYYINWHYDWFSNKHHKKALENTKWLTSFLYCINKNDDCYFVFCSVFDVMFIIKQIVVSKCNMLKYRLCIINSFMWLLTTKCILNMVITGYHTHTCISTYSCDARSNDNIFLSHCYRDYSLHFDI